MHRETRLDRIEIESDGHILVRFHKLIVDDDGTPLMDTASYHRTSFFPGQDIDTQLDAVRDHLEYMKFPLADDAGVREKCKAVAALIQTQEIVEAYKKRMAELNPYPELRDTDQPLPGPTDAP